MGNPSTQSPLDDVPPGNQPTAAPGTGNFDQALQHFSAGRLGHAAGVCHAILGVTPRYAPALHLLGIILADQGQLAEGLRLVEQALEQDHHSAAFHFTRGQILMRLGNPAASIGALEESAHLDPNNRRIPQQLALALLAGRRLSEAETVVGTALEKWPESAELLDASGMVLMAQGRHAQACVVLERAREVAPDFPDTYGNLAILYEQGNRLDSALDIVKQGLRRWPEHRTLRFVRARCLRRLGKYTEADLVLQELLSGELTDKLHADIEYELGWCADGMDHTAEAYRHFTQANLLAGKLPAYNATQGADYLRMLATLQKQFERGWAASWDSLPFPEKSEDLAFIIGFPRSGTTLLDTMLGAHPEFRVLEEQATVQAVLERLAMYAGGYPAGLATLTPEQQLALRAAYFQALAAYPDASRRQRLLDKSPFNTVHAGLIHRIFPEAKLIFVARHPCDVCLSCFMNNFEMNSGTQHFTRLDTTVNLYCQVMALWMTYVKILPLCYQVVRYEDLVEQPEKELRRLLDGIGVPWSENVVRHTSYAMERGHIPTPSYAQVNRPIYIDACDRWRRYADYMQPFLKKLQPYIETFGYAI
ncbi:MAG TPA: sulfotransferase [Gammaproteobacteria bacterium]|nr:sulfotransferase [Gammaproteobacteria bacterium]